METFVIMVGFGFIRYNASPCLPVSTPNAALAKKFSSKKEAHEFAVNRVGGMFEIVEIIDR